MNNLALFVFGVAALMSWHDCKNRRESGNTPILYFLKEAAEMLGHIASLLLLVFVISQLNYYKDHQSALIYFALLLVSYSLSRLRKKDDIFWISVLSVTFFFAPRVFLEWNFLILSEVLIVVLGIIGIRFVHVGLHLRLSFASPPASLRGFGFYLLVICLLGAIGSGLRALML